jgi:hypothetical protein
VAPRELHQQAREEVVAGADHRHVQPPAGDALVLGHRLFGLLELLDDLAAGLQHLRARGREVDLLSELLEKAAARHGPRACAPASTRPLREVQLLRGARKAAVAGDRFEHLELAKGGMAHARNYKPEGMETIK